MTGLLIRRFVTGWGIALLSLTLTRLVFFVNNLDAFQGEISVILLSFLHGIRFDSVSTAYTLLPFVVVLPMLSRIRNTARFYYLAVLGAMNVINCTDAEFFRFISRRSTDDLFRFAFLSNDIFNIGLDLVRNFWYLLAFYIMVMLMVLWLYNRYVHPKENHEPVASGWNTILAMCVFAFLTVVGMRGGLQRIPIGMIDAGQGSDPRFSVLELNSAFTILKTFGKPDLEEVTYFSDGENPVSPIMKRKSQGHLKGQNVVVLIVESLGSEYMGVLNGKGHTYAPFLDSLAGQGLVMVNAYANGHRSIEGVPACIAALPTLMYEPFITSRYAQNRFSSLPNLLAERGYGSVFLHGGENGTMGLEAFAYQAGFDRYLGSREYPESAHHDGHWGIFDHHFLNYATTVFSEMEQPFMAGLFTLSSHLPYTVPEDLQGRFPKGTLPIHESIGYADWSIRQFFQAAQKTDWYDSTLFVITADHTSVSEYKEFQTTLGALDIPIIFFHPHDTVLKGTSSTVMQQADIMPTVLSLLGYDRPFFSLGQDVFDTAAPHMAVAFKFDRYQVLCDGRLLTFDGEQTIGCFDIASDPMLQTDVKEGQSEQTALQERLLRGYLQNYSRAVVHNRMTSKAWKENEP